MKSVELFCPAKVNLYLAITGRRDDGFHDLVSVAAPVGVGDRLTINETTNGECSLECDDAAVPIDGSNLILKAATLFRDRTGWTGGAHFNLRKVTPMGAGLGGGSSDAVGALLGLNQLAGEIVERRELQQISAELGSDCPLFFENQPVVMRGRGEKVSLLPDSGARRLVGQQLLLLKPAFGVNTAWAYGRMATNSPHRYLPEPAAERRLNDWMEEISAPPDALSFNSFEAIVGEKHVALPTMAKALRAEFGVQLHLSGSGSACYLWTDDGTQTQAITEFVREGWGSSAWIQETEIRAERIIPD